MLIKETAQVAAQAVQEGIGIRWLLTEKEGAPNFAMRVIELQPGVVFTPHQHPYEHEIYVLEGQGVVTNLEGDVGSMRPGVFLLVPPDEIHGYRNTGDTALKFICVIPLQK
ncbi:MAG TPA: cupin domain-containing protein [Anaerolineae bacterium]|nr:cupin domain-containing protein [Anaerolineae bacterium]HQI83922.1 cupin domain-containing protein [Anaerolineae bacterium]